MIKREELRVGNILGFRETDYVSVYCINGDDTIRHLQVLKEYGCFRLNQYQPIPLTEEILLKCGFEKIEYNSEETGYGIEYVLIRGGYSGFRLEYYEDFSIGIMGSENDQAVTPNVDVLCYLHQLQNLYFALTGEELKIEL